MKNILLLLVIVLTFISCERKNRSGVIPQTLAPSEKVVILDMNPRVNNGMVSYKVRRLSTKTVAFIQMGYINLYETKDTILWRF